MCFKCDWHLVRPVCKSSAREIGVGYMGLEVLENEEVRYLAHKHGEFRKRTEPYLCQNSLISFLI